MSEPIAKHGQLAGICGHDGSNWEKILIDDSKRLLVTIAEQLSAIEVYQNDPAKSVTAQYHWYNGAWRRSNLLWGFNAIWDENLGGTADSTIWDEYTSTIPAEELWVLQGVSIYNAAGGGGMTFVAVHRASGGILRLNYASSVLINETILATGNWVLRAGDRARVYMDTITIGNALGAGVIGYKMKLDM